MPDADARHTTRARYEEMADALLMAYRTGTPEAMARHWALTWHRRPWQGMRTYVQVDLGRPAGEDVEITLDDARWLVAREHGFDDWSALLAFCQSIREGTSVLPKPVGVLEPNASGHRGSPRRWRIWDDVLQRLASGEATGLVAHGAMTDAMLADLATCVHLTTLQLGGSTALTDAGVRHLAHLPHLRHLDLSGTAITDAGMPALRELRALETLSLAGTRVTDVGIDTLRRCDALTSVNLSWTKTGDGALRSLAGKPALCQLQVGHAVTDDGLRALHDLPCYRRWRGGDVVIGLLSPDAHPNRLSLPSSVSAAGIANLRGLDGLFGLDLNGGDAPRDGASLRPLLDLPNLGWLSVDVADDAMTVIGQLPRLRALLCQDTRAGDDGFVALSRSPSLEMIWGRRCHQLQRRGFQALANMPSLRALSVSCKSVDDEGIAALPHFPALRELMPMDIPDAGYRHIARCHALEAVLLMYCRDTSDAATQHLTGLRQLRRYFASYTQVTDRTPELLSTIDTLESVTFESCATLTDAGVATLARLPRLRELRVSGRHITQGVARAFEPTVEVHVSD